MNEHEKALAARLRPYVRDFDIPAVLEIVCSEHPVHGLRQTPDQMRRELWLLQLSQRALMTRVRRLMVRSDRRLARIHLLEARLLSGSQVRTIPTTRRKK